MSRKSSVFLPYWTEAPRKDVY